MCSTKRWLGASLLFLLSFMTSFDLQHRLKLFPKSSNKCTVFIGNYRILSVFERSDF